MVTKEEAFKMAQEKNLDLIIIREDTQPPIVKLQNYGKFLYQQQKVNKKQTVKLRRDQPKNIRVGFREGEHDQRVKVQKIDVFLREGRRINVQLTLRGREKMHKQLAREKLDKFLTFISEPYKVISNLKETPFGFIITISPSK